MNINDLYNDINAAQSNKTNCDSLEFQKKKRIPCNRWLCQVNRGTKHKTKPEEMKFLLIKVNIDKWWGVGEWTMPRCHVDPTISPSFQLPVPFSSLRCAKWWQIYGFGYWKVMGIVHCKKKEQFIN